MSQLVGQPDTAIHTTVGWLFTAIAGLGIVLGWRAARTLLSDSVRFRRTAHALPATRNWDTAVTSD